MEEKFYVPARGTKGAGVIGDLMTKMAQPVFRRLVKRYQALPSAEPGKFMGFPVLVLTCVGAKSGIERTHAMGGFPDGQDTWLGVAANGGSASHPMWFHNVAKNPDKVYVQVGNRKFHAQVESLRGAERQEAYARVVEVAPMYGGYSKKTDREIPVLRFTPAL